MAWHSVVRNSASPGNPDSPVDSSCGTASSRASASSSKVQLPLQASYAVESLTTSLGRPYAAAPLGRWQALTDQPHQPRTNPNRRYSTPSSGRQSKVVGRCRSCRGGSQGPLRESPCKDPDGMLTSRRRMGHHDDCAAGPPAPTRRTGSSDSNMVGGQEFQMPMQMMKNKSIVYQSCYHQDKTTSR